MGVERAGSFGLVASQVGCHSRMSSAGVCETAVRGPPGGWVTQVLARRWACCTYFHRQRINEGILEVDIDAMMWIRVRVFSFLHRQQNDSADRR